MIDFLDWLNSPLDFRPFFSDNPPACGLQWNTSLTGACALEPRPPGPEGNRANPRIDTTEQRLVILVAPEVCLNPRHMGIVELDQGTLTSEEFHALADFESRWKAASVDSDDPAVDSAIVAMEAALEPREIDQANWDFITKSRHRDVPQIENYQLPKKQR